MKTTTMISFALLNLNYASATSALLRGKVMQRIHAMQTSDSTTGSCGEAQWRRYCDVPGTSSSAQGGFFYNTVGSSELSELGAVVSDDFADKEQCADFCSAQNEDGCCFANVYQGQCVFYPGVQVSTEDIPSRNVGRHDKHAYACTAADEEEPSGYCSWNYCSGVPEGGDYCNTDQDACMACAANSATPSESLWCAGGPGIYEYLAHDNNAIKGKSIELFNNEPSTRLEYVGSVEHCVHACNALPECVGFVDNYNANKPYCVLKYSTSTQYGRSGKTVYLKP